MHFVPPRREREVRSLLGWPADDDDDDDGSRVKGRRRRQRRRLVYWVAG